MLKGKKILLGVTGGIAVYKACELVRLFKKNGALVKVVMTDAATEFVRPLSFETLSQNKVYHKMFGESLEDLEHISLARFPDCIVVAPATANCLAKLAHGIADDLLSTVLIATASNVPICLAPAMNKEMWGNRATQDNLQILKNRNIHIFGPGKGCQACGDIGEGRILESLEILELTRALLATSSSALPPRLLLGKQVLVTAGPTLEPIDPVRYISNRSSGKMGYAIAEAAVTLGAKVVLVSGPTNLPTPAGVFCINVQTALEMHQVVIAEAIKCDIFISAAAVADYRIETVAAEKIKKTADTLELKLVKNPDILYDVASLSKPPMTVGFAAETNDVIAFAKAKLKGKKVDMIVANEVGVDKGFDSEDNALTVLTCDGQEISLGRKSKVLLAAELMQIIANNL